MNERVYQESDSEKRKNPENFGLTLYPSPHDLGRQRRRSRPAPCAHPYSRGMMDRAGCIDLTPWQTVAVVSRVPTFWVVSVPRSSGGI